jgi:restriction system protein
MSPRQRSQSALEEVLAAVSQQPLWVSLVVAVVVFMVGWFLVPVIAVPAAHRQLWIDPVHTVALIGSGLVILAGFVGVLQRFRRRYLLDSSHVRDLDWRDFEQLVGEAYRRLGYAVTETGGGGPDGGFDLDLRGKDGRTLVQCKQWRSFRVGVRETRELLGVMVHERADRGVMITTGSFTADALALARGKPIDLIDGNALAKLIKEVRKAPHAASVPDPAPSPTCPKCGNGMVRRMARHGAHTGSSFWGCSTYPACTETLPAA